MVDIISIYFFYSLLIAANIFVYYQFKHCSSTTGSKQLNFTRTRIRISVLKKNTKINISAQHAQSVSLKAIKFHKNKKFYTPTLLLRVAC